MPDKALVIEGWVHYGCHIKLYKNSCEPQILTNRQYTSLVQTQPLNFYRNVLTYFVYNPSFASKFFNTFLTRAWTILAIVNFHALEIFQVWRGVFLVCALLFFIIFLSFSQMKCFKIRTLKYSLRAFLNKKDKNQNLTFLKKMYQTTI